MSKTSIFKTNNYPKKTEIDCSNQSLNEIPQSLFRIDLGIVQKLDLRQNLLSNLSAAIFTKLKNLELLQLSENLITLIPIEIAQLKKLKEFILDFNQITNLPTNIGELINLEKFSISNNKLLYLPFTITNLNFSLKYLDVSINNLKYIDIEIGELKSLTHLFLHSNHFISIPSSISLLKNLKEFSLDWFKYTFPPLPKIIKESFGGVIIDSMKHILQVLSDNKMKECALKTFIEHFSADKYDIDKKDLKGRTLLHNACSDGDFGVIQGLLLQNKIEINSLDNEGCSPLLITIKENRIEIASLLLEAGANSNYWNYPFGGPLHFAIHNQDIGLVKLLIQKGAEVNQKDSEGNTPLHILMSIFSSNPYSSSLIAESLIMGKCKTNLKNKDLMTPFHVAIRKCQNQGLLWIINNNKRIGEMGFEMFDINAYCGTKNWTGLHIATSIRNIEIVKILVDNGISLFVNSSDHLKPSEMCRGNITINKYLKKAEANKAKAFFSCKNTKYHLRTFSLAIFNYKSVSKNVEKPPQSFYSSKNCFSRGIEAGLTKTVVGYGPNLVNKENIIILSNQNKSPNAFYLKESIIGKTQKIFEKYNCIYRLIQLFIIPSFSRIWNDLIKSCKDFNNNEIRMDLIYLISFFTNESINTEVKVGMKLEKNALLCNEYLNYFYSNKLLSIKKIEKDTFDNKHSSIQASMRKIHISRNSSKQKASNYFRLETEIYHSVENKFRRIV